MSDCGTKQILVVEAHLECGWYKELIMTRSLLVCPVFESLVRIFSEKIILLFEQLQNLLELMIYNKPSSGFDKSFKSFPILKNK